MGGNQAWNHAGNIAAALTGMLIIGWWGIVGIGWQASLCAIP